MTVGMKDNPIFMMGVVFGITLVHAQQHVDETYPEASEEIRAAEIERMTNLMLFEFGNDKMKEIKGVKQL